MWDVLYMPIPDVFRTAFQTGPMDLGTPVFLPARRAAAAAAVREVNLGRGPQKLQECFAEHRGIMCCGVNWDRHSESPPPPPPPGRPHPQALPPQLPCTPLCCTHLAALTFVFVCSFL